jgi:hypothetical protein
VIQGLSKLTDESVGCLFGPMPGRDHRGEAQHGDGRGPDEHLEREQGLVGRRPHERTESEQGARDGHPRQQEHRRGRLARTEAKGRPDQTRDAEVRERVALRLG